MRKSPFFLLCLLLLPSYLFANLLCVYSGIIGIDESLYLAFKRLNVPDKAWVSVVEALKDSVKFNRVMPGESFKLFIDSDGNLISYEQKRNQFEMIKVYRQDGKLQCQRVTPPLKKLVKVAQGRVKSSLWMAMIEQGLPVGLADVLIHIFAYDIDFPTETRKGDEFTVVYEEYKTSDGEHVKLGDIVSAEYKGKYGIYHAYRFEIPNVKWHYYNDKGQSLKKTLLRTPVHYSRISSRFSYHRRHPILGIVRPHLGVDYAAPTGTPVIAAGNGIITYAGKKDGFGNYILINHGVISSN